MALAIFDMRLLFECYKYVYVRYRTPRFKNVFLLINLMDYYLFLIWIKNVLFSGVHYIIVAHTY